MQQRKLIQAIAGLYKTTTLAALYGQGAVNMSKRMNLIIDYGQDLFVKIKNTF